MFKALSRLFRRRDGTASLVQQDGWTGIYVGDYDSAPTWAYTIGFLTTLGAPEVIVFDVSKATANGVFHDVFQQLKSGELVLEDGKPWPEKCMWRRVHPSRFEDPENRWLALAEVYDTVIGAGQDQATLARVWNEFEAFQLVLSDNEGHFPWEAGYDESLRFRQRELYLPVESSGPHPP